MSRTIVECLIPAVPCAECEERDCCRDERRVKALRARVAELEAREVVCPACGEAMSASQTGTVRELTERAMAAEQRVAELEADLADADEVRTRRCNELIRDSNDYARMMEQRINSAESRASAAMEAHAALLSRIAGDGTLDAMERASSAEQRAKRLEGALRDFVWLYECGYLRHEIGAEAERQVAWRLEAARAALAASEAEVSHG